MNYVVDNYKLSIITVNLNNANGLEKTILSVISQSFTEFQYIIVDGASTDGSTDVINKFAHRLSYTVSEADSGIYSAMNKGIKVAHGEYLLFLNSGDTLANQEVLATILPELSEKDIIYGNLLIVEDAKIWLKTYPSDLKFSYFLKDSLPHPATFIKREQFYRVAFYNEKYRIVSDWEFFLLAIIKFNASYKHINFTVSEFILDGISSKLETVELLQQERNNVLRTDFKSFVADYEELVNLKREIRLLKKSRMYKLQLKLRKLLKKGA